MTPNKILPIQELTAQAFAPFGEVISVDGVGATAFDLGSGSVGQTAVGQTALGETALGETALGQSSLRNGSPRFYVMTLSATAMCFDRITRHCLVTQCLAATSAVPWLMALAPPNPPEDPKPRPDESRLVAFEIPPHTGIMLHRGTWHAGPHFAAGALAFFNLELVDTNTADHHTETLSAIYGFAATR